MKDLNTILCCSRKYPYPSHGRFFKLNPPTPPEIPFQCHNWAFEIPLPLGISVNLPWGGHGYFLALHILCFKLNTVENYAFLKRGFSKQLETKTTFAPQPSCFERKKRRKDGRTNIRDVPASWKKVKCLYLYSTDTAFTQHKHDKYSLQTKGQIPEDQRFLKGT